MRSLLALATIGAVAFAKEWSYDLLSSATNEISFTGGLDINYGTHYEATEDETAMTHTENYGLDVYSVVYGTVRFNFPQIFEYEATVSLYPFYITAIDHYFIFSRWMASGGFGFEMYTQTDYSLLFVETDIRQNAGTFSLSLWDNIA
jgi:hypothetical protein